MGDANGCARFTSEILHFAQDDMRLEIARDSSELRRKADQLAFGGVVAFAG